MKKFLALGLLLASLEVSAQATSQIIVETNHTSLVLSVGKDNRLHQCWLGKRLPSAEYGQLPAGPESYLTAGMENQFEPAIRMVHADGNPSLELQYVSSSTTKTGDDITTTAIVLKDPVYPVTVTLFFTAYYNEDVIKARTTILHQEKNPVLLTQYASCMLHAGGGKYWLTQFHGDWAREMQPVEEQLTNGIKTIESKLGSRTNFYQTQAFFLALGKPCTETTGEVIAGTLAWTGNFQYTFEVDQRSALCVRTGINPFASEYRLEPGETFTTPDFIFTYSSNGKGQTSRNLHRWARSYGVLDGNGTRMTLLNNWETTYFGFNETRLTDLFGEAQKLGVDLFLLDDGWFGNKYPRNDDKAGLGDWQEDSVKLPHGISFLTEAAEKKGIKFGIWLEPEMVNPKSELYQKHPDWILKLPNRPEDLQRNQLVLDLANPRVQDFIFSVVDNLLTKHPGLAYIKWDCNRSMTNPWSPYLKDRQWRLFIDYTRGLYQTLGRIRAKYPHLPMMLCSGGGRTDYGALPYFTEFWPSDNTDPLERVYIQWGYSFFFPANTIAAHITNSGKQTLKFKTDVAMMDKLGYDIRVDQFTPEELQFSREALKTYQRIHDVIWYGDLYRLESPWQSNRAVLLYVTVNKDRSILFDYHLNSRRQDIFNRVALQGLDPKKNYHIREINLFPGTKSQQPDNDKVFSGDYLMTIGWNPSRGRNTPLSSFVYELTAE